MSDARIIWKPRIVGPSQTFFGVPSYTTAWANQVVANGGPAPSSTVLGQINTLVASLQSSFGTRLENSFRRFWLLANFDNNENASFTSLINPTSTEMTKSGTFLSTTLGYQSDIAAGTPGFINTHWQPSLDGGTIYTTSGASFGFYDLTSNTSSAPNYVPMGGDDGVSISDSVIAVWNVNGHGLGVLGSYTSCLADLASEGNSRGFHIVVRESATNSRYDKYDPTGSFPGASTNVGATTLLPVVVYLCGQNVGGTATAFPPEKLAFAYTGRTMTTTDTANLSVAVNAYMTSLGINIY